MAYFVRKNETFPAGRSSISNSAPKMARLMWILSKHREFNFRAHLRNSISSYKYINNNVILIKSQMESFSIYIG